MGSGYIPTLDGWRAVAILLVVALHVALGIHGPDEPRSRAFAALVDLGSYGVDVFFALSGYLIATLLLREKAAGATGILGRFYARRAFRILPPLLAYLAVVFALAAVGVLPAIRPAEAASCLLFFRNYLPGTNPTEHLWSLSVEEHFYLVAPWVVLALKPGAAAWRAVEVGLASSAWRMVASRHGALAAIVPGAEYCRTDCRLDGLMGGLVLALALDDPATRARLARVLTGRVALGLALAVAAVEWARPAVARSAFAAAFPLILASTVLRPGDALGRALEARPLRWLGRIS